MLSQGIIPAINVGCFSSFFADRIMLLVQNNGLISFYDESFLFLRIAILGFKYTIGTTDFTVIVLVSTRT